MSNGPDDKDEDTLPPGAPPPGVPRVTAQPSAPLVPRVTAQPPAAAPAQPAGFRPIVTPARKPTGGALPTVPSAPPVAPARPLPTISPTTVVAPPAANPVISPATAQRPNPAQASGQTPRPALPQIAPPVMAPITPVAPTIAPASAGGTPRPAPAPQRPATPVIAPPVMSPGAPQRAAPVIAPPVMSPGAPQRPAAPVIAPPVMSAGAPQRPAPVIAPPVAAPPRAASSGVLVPPAPPAAGAAKAIVPPAPPAAAPGNLRPPTQPPGSIVPPAAAAPRRASPIPESGAVEDITPQQAQELRRLATTIDTLDYFQVLGLAQTAVGGEIKKAFYRESRTYHPDRFFHMPDSQVKDDIGHLYKRITEAYYVLKDDQKRKKYLTDLAGPDRANKLRYTEATESELKAEARKVVEEEFGTNPKSRPFFKSGMADYEKQNWASAERNFKMGLMYEPGNARFKEKLTEVQAKLEEDRRKNSSFMIK